jgi:16S rRNA (guanine527-N7)-methyltransferase
MDDYRRALVDGARKIGLPLDDALADRMSLHHALLVRWAEKINLTAIKDPTRAAHLHGLDSLLFVELIEQGAKLKTVDVGSGAGFPGIVVLLARPELDMTLIEPLRKRASFLRVVLAELKRSDVAVLEARLGEPQKGPPPSAPWPADLILSRATIPVLDLITRAAPRLADRGRLITTQGAGAPPLDAIRQHALRAGLAHEARIERTLPNEEQRILDVFVREAVGVKAD